MSLVDKPVELRTVRRESLQSVEYSLPRGYEPIELAGMGAFAEVWKAIDTGTGRHCALKRLRPERADDPTARQLIENEAQASQAVQSRHLVKLRKADLRAEVPFLVFDWLEGEPLENECNGQSPLSLRRAVWIARQCADGMYDLECAGFAHGDIKPQNIFITLGGEVKLLDLGFVRPILPPSAHGPSHHSPAAAWHTTSHWVGTPEYAAPESLSKGLTQPIAKDIYSLGVTLYRMLTGRLPFVGETASVVAVGHRQGKPTLLRHYRPDAPRELSDLVGRLLAKQPLRRPHSLRSLIRELVDLELLVLSAELASGA